MNGTYAKCLKFSKSTKKWEEPNKKLGLVQNILLQNKPKNMKKIMENA